MPKKIHVMTPWLRLKQYFDGEREWCDDDSRAWVCGEAAAELFGGLVEPVRFHASTHRLPQSHRCKITVMQKDRMLDWYSIAIAKGVRTGPLGPLHYAAEVKLKTAGLGPGDTIYIAAEVN